MASSTAIQESLDNIESEIARLEKARDALLELVGGEGDADEVEEAPKPNKAKSRRSRAKSTEDEAEEKPSPRRSRRIDKRAADRKASKDNGGGEKGTRKDQIIALLDEGMSPREVADELGIATNYVYNVKRGM